VDQRSNICSDSYSFNGYKKEEIIHIVILEH
jgi:hypothetical protein